MEACTSCNYNQFLLTMLMLWCGSNNFAYSETFEWLGKMSCFRRWDWETYKLEQNDTIGISANKFYKKNMHTVIYYIYNYIVICYIYNYKVIYNIYNYIVIYIYFTILKLIVNSLFFSYYQSLFLNVDYTCRQRGFFNSICTGLL